MRKRIGIFCMIAGAVLIAGALSLLLYNQMQDEEAGEAADAVLPVLQEAQAVEEPEKEGEMPTMTIDGYEYIGYLTIPVLELELPVMSDWSYEQLKIAPCRYFGSAYTDDLVICGHNYDRHFGRLQTLQAGDEIYFTDAEGVSIAYEVKTVEILEPTAVQEMLESGYDLTLYTCTYGGATRVTVRCDRAES